MTQTEYDQKKRECFVQFCKDNGIDQEVNISIFDAFDQIFDRAYALGKQFGNSEQVDAEGEEILTVSRKRVQEMCAANERIKADFPDKETAHISDHINHVLKHLFGSKCLPDEVDVAENTTTTQKNAESKFHPDNKGHSDQRKKLFLEEKLAIARLGCMRIWSLKDNTSSSALRPTKKKFIGNAVEVTIARAWCEALCSEVEKHLKNRVA